VIRATAVVIHVADDPIRPPGKSHAPGDNSGDSLLYPPYFAAVADNFTGDSRLPALCHVLEHLHRIAVNPCASPWLIGVTATIDATDSRAPMLFLSSDRRASSSKFPAAALASYKFSPPSAPQHHHALSHPTLPPVDHQCARILGFPQFGFHRREIKLAAASPTQVSSSLLVACSSIPRSSLSSSTPSIELDHHPSPGTRSFVRMVLGRRGQGKLGYHSSN
jgi:hypothetical protein